MDMSRCQFCGAPSILLEWNKDKSLKDPDAFVEIAGPSLNPEIKNWCRGTCWSIIIKVALSEEHIEEEITKGEFHSRPKQDCIDFINNVFDDLRKDIKKTLSHTYEDRNERNFGLPEGE
tara:strand:- start:418 stop:774 length:357 start_codon:yes stop_codon:yes gene_type:complete